MKCPQFKKIFILSMLTGLSSLALADSTKMMAPKSNPLTSRAVIDMTQCKASKSTLSVIGVENPQNLPSSQKDYQKITCDPGYVAVATGHATAAGNTAYLTNSQVGVGAGYVIKDFRTAHSIICCKLINKWEKVKPPTSNSVTPEPSRESPYPPVN